MYGLIIKKKWLDKILSGEKTLEIRGSKTAHICERIALIESGSSQIKGFCVIRSVIALTEEKWETERDRHCVELSFEDLLKRYKTAYAWELTDVIACKQPVPYKHPQGAVIWVNLEDLGLEDKITSEIAGGKLSGMWFQISYRRYLYSSETSICTVVGYENAERMYKEKCLDHEFVEIKKIPEY